MMLTSGGEPGDVARCEQLGVAGYLTKPVKQSELLSTILSAMGAAAPPDAAPAAAVADQPALPPLKVLLAEDSLVNQKLAMALLQRAGHSVVLVSDGRQAVEAFGAQDFDVVLMDVQMPEMDGFEATAAIRDKQRTTGRRVPIIAMTAQRERRPGTLRRSRHGRVRGQTHPVQATVRKNRRRTPRRPGGRCRPGVGKASRRLSSAGRDRDLCAS